MSLDGAFKRFFGDDEPTHLGSGWVSGVASVVCGALSLGGVLCFHFPGLLTAPNLRAHYPIPLMRGLLQATLIASFVLAALSAVLRRRRVLALTGSGLGLAAMLLGGASVPLPDRVDSEVGIGLEWFLLNLLAVAVVFVPMERAFPRLKDQLVFRPGWTVDGSHFLASHLLVQVFSVASIAPATALRERFIWAAATSAVANLPLWIQIPAVLVTADLAQYCVHRAFHQVPWLWRFHSVHHSSEQMDWLAGSRLHLLDALATRSMALVPALLLGFSPTAIAAYVTFVSFHAVFIHGNVSFRLRWLEPFLVTPRIHHFHHAREALAIDKNFAVHVPIIDRVLGTQFLPQDRWPSGYGVADGKPMPDGWWRQLAAPFVR